MNAHRNWRGELITVETYGVAAADLALVRKGRGLAGDTIMGKGHPGWHIGQPVPGSVLPRHLRVAA